MGTHIKKLPDYLKDNWILSTGTTESGGVAYIEISTYNKTDIADRKPYPNPYENQNNRGSWYFDTTYEEAQKYVRTRIDIRKSQDCTQYEFRDIGKVASVFLKGKSMWCTDPSINTRNPNIPESKKCSIGTKEQLVAEANRFLKSQGIKCTIEFGKPCAIPPSIADLLDANDKKLFVIAKVKPSFHHSLFLYNPDFDDMESNPPNDPRGKVTALKNVPRYNVVDCQWTPAGKATFKFSDCSDDICEGVNNFLANNLDQLIKDKIGTIQSGNENQFLAKKFPTCCSTFNKDSTLSPDIGDLLEEYGKTFYLLGSKGEKEQPKLYLFDLGQVQGGLKYTHILDAVVLIQENCEWIEDEPLKQTIKFSQLKGEIDTNFYLLTPEKLEKPSTITTITHRKANEYLLKYFPTCSTKRPEGGGNPNDNLKPDFGNGGGGIGGSGGEGFFPENNNPLPNPEIPPCSGQDGGSQTPVSEIYLLSVPELTPSYADTYDFLRADEQAHFFKSKKHFKVINYSYLRKESAIQVGSHVDNLKCYNYLMYKNKAGKWYYCFILDKQYINERTARLIIANDVIQTYMFDYVLDVCYVERCHVDRWNPDGTPTDEFEPEGLDFGEPMQVSGQELPYAFNDTFIAVCANPLGEIPSRAKKKEEEQTKGVDENAEI